MYCVAWLEWTNLCSQLFGATRKSWLDVTAYFSCNESRKWQLCYELISCWGKSLFLRLCSPFHKRELKPMHDEMSFSRQNHACALSRSLHEIPRHSSLWPTLACKILFDEHLLSASTKPRLVISATIPNMHAELSSMSIFLISACCPCIKVSVMHRLVTICTIKLYKIDLVFPQGELMHQIVVRLPIDKYLEDIARTPSAKHFNAAIIALDTAKRETKKGENCCLLFHLCTTTRTRSLWTLQVVSCNMPCNIETCLLNALPTFAAECRGK